MNNASILSLATISGIKKTPNDLIHRDSYIDLISKTTDKYDIVFIDGSEGVGKSTLLLDFIWKNQFNTVSHVIETNFNYTYSYDCLLDNIYSQLYFFCFNETIDPDKKIDDSLFTSINGKLFKKIKQNKAPLYFVFDGFSELNSNQIEKLISIFDNLPWGRAKFIFSGSKDNLKGLFSGKNLTDKEITLPNFGLNETKQYMQVLGASEEEMQELHTISLKGNPEILNTIKREIKNNDDLKAFLESTENKDKNAIFEKQWSVVQANNESQIQILSIIAFTDIKLDIIKISYILVLKYELVKELLSALNFIDIDNEENVNFQSETFRRFVQLKLKKNEDWIYNTLIKYYEVNIENEDRLHNLPNLYRKAKKWETLTQFYSLDAFINIIEKHESLGNLNSHFSQGYDAAKNSKDKFNESYLRFALHKSSIKDLEKKDLWASEIEARVKLDDYDQALYIANSTFLKEDRLKLLAILAKQIKLNDQTIDPNLVDQIKSLYNQIDFTKIRDKAFEIASLLIYCSFELAIELVEKISDSTAGKNSLDYALTYLSLYATEANRKSKTRVADVDLINSKIQDNDLKGISKGISFLSEKYNAEQIISHVANLSKFSQKLFFLKSWITNNQTNEDVGQAIKYTLEEIIKTSVENVPNATSLAEIARPLPNLTNKEELKDLIIQFDAHKSTIQRPTKDFVRLQISIAEALLKLDEGQAKDRVFEILYFIDEINDLSIKTDCYCLVWLFSEKNKTTTNLNIESNLGISIDSLVQSNVDLILKDTAFHYKMIEFIAKTMITTQSVFVYDSIKKLNTLERRDVAYKFSIISYIQTMEIGAIEFPVVAKFYTAIKDAILKEDIIIEIIDKYYYSKTTDLNLIDKLIPYYDLIPKMFVTENKCYVITHVLQVLKTASSLNSSITEKLLKELHSSWDKIDAQWDKIEIGFLVAKDLAGYSKEEAIKYLKFANDLKHRVPFSSNSIVGLYLNSIKIAINAFRGVLLSKDDVSNEISELATLIDLVESTGEKLKLWSKISLQIYTVNKIELFKEVCKEHLINLLTLWDKPTTTYQLSTITEISPTIFLYSNNLFFTDYLPLLKERYFQASVQKICDSILSKSQNSSITHDSIKLAKLEYTDLNDLCLIIEKLSDDYLIQNYIDEIIDVIRSSKVKLTIDQKNSIKSKLKAIVDSKLPSPGGILHDGYKIICEASLLTLETHKPDPWQLLINRAYLINNASDKALVLMILAGKITVKSKAKKIELMEAAFNLTKTIPSVYDKTNRFDASWENWLDIDKGKFTQHIKLAYQDLLQSKDGELKSLRNLIDVAQQHDSKLAESFVTMLDQDDTRKNLKEPLQKRIEENTKIKSACQNYNSLEHLESKEFSKVFRKNLDDLKSGKLLSREVANTISVLDKASSFSLRTSADAYNYFIFNAIKKYETNKKDANIISSIFNATIENSKLISLLSTDNLYKIKNLYKDVKHSNSSKNPIIHAGDANLGYEQIRIWLNKNIKEDMFIIDPYFTEKQLNILLLFKEIMPDCNITVLTSKKGGNNSHITLSDSTSANTEVYKHAWQKITSSPPTSITIKIVWDKNTSECPFHDRWYIAGEDTSCLYIGTSVDGIGNRDSQFIELDKDSLVDVKNMIDKYIYKETRIVSNFNLKYERIDLED